MFERYTEEARNAVWFAKEEAIALDTSQVETEHLLVGILRADPVLRASVQIDTTRVCLNGGSASKFQPLSHESKRIPPMPPRKRSDRITRRSLAATLRWAYSVRKIARPQSCSVIRGLHGKS